MQGKTHSHSVPHVLVVDDDELVSEYLGALLEVEDYAVKVMNDSSAALKYFTQNPDSFDLVVTDQVMPVLTGVEMSRAILAIRPDLPIVLITGYSEQINHENAESFGLSGFFQKPINEELLLSRISELLSR
jgi:CheY-like chemotaxis protein